jgi:parvulin-like peptidyl-prolyl isomerase
MVRQIATSLLLAIAIGCGSNAPHQLTADSFLSQPTVSNDSVPPSQPPAIEAAATEVPKKASMMPTDGLEGDTLRALDPIPPVPTTEPTEISAATQPTEPVPTPAAPVVLHGGVYMTIGGVVANVNGSPIYAHTILALLDKELAAKARESDSDQFREFVIREVLRTRQELEANEVEYAAAERELSDDDKKIVLMLTMQFRKQKITEAGGSEELARRKATSDGIDFDEMIHEQNRRYARDLFYQRRIYPRIEVTPDDMLAFYRQNFTKLFSEQDQAQFRVIKIDPARLGGNNPRAAAISKINYIRTEAVRGDDFTALASGENHDDYLRTRGGDPGGWIKRNSYCIDSVEKAVWQLQPGQITPVIEDNECFYIAKLEEKKIGQVRSFDDQSVQEEIHNRLFQAQFAVLRDNVRDDLTRNAAIIADDDQLITVVDMAMQKYVQWAKR